MPLNEAQTRVLQIDPQLRAADWRLNDRTQVQFEVPVDGYDAEPWNGVTDYCLYDASGNVLAVVEAKRCARNAREADEQLRHYVNEIAKRQTFAPFGFMANGHEIWFWEIGLANPRLVAGFFTPEDLERLRFLRQNRQPIEATPINSSIVNRPYQHEAIRRLGEAFAANKRRALLVMATGTGKTRVSMAVIDVFLRSQQAQNVLFLADRDALVEQALTDGFKAHLPNEPRDRIYTFQIDKTKRLFVATEQTLALCYTRITDKIIADLEQGVRTWMKPWNAGNTAGRITRPLRHNGAAYSGINILMLWAEAMDKGFTAPIWMTFKQAQELGANVRKGEKGSLVVYANSITRTEEDAKGEETEREIHYMKGYTVFNVEQIDGLPEHYYGKPIVSTTPVERIDHAEAFFKATKADIRYPPCLHAGTTALWFGRFRSFFHPRKPQRCGCLRRLPRGLCCCHRHPRRQASRSGLR